MILFNLSCHGLLDLSAYDAYNQGRLADNVYEIDQEEVKSHLSKVKVNL